MSLSEPRIPVIILGAAGHGAVLAHLVRLYPHLYVKGYLDPTMPEGTMIADAPVLGTDDDLAEFVADEPHIGAVACGLVAANTKIRVGAFERCIKDTMMPPLVHPSAVIDASAYLGHGVQVLANAVVGADAVLMDGVVVNSSAVVSHDCFIDSHTHIAPGAILAGGIQVGKRTLIGMGVTILVGLSIGDDLIIPTGSDIFCSVPTGTKVRAKSAWMGDGK